MIALRKSKYNPPFKKTINMPNTTNAEQQTKDKLLYKKSTSYPRETAKSTEQQKAVKGASPTLFDSKKRDGSPDSNITGSSSNWDPFRNAMDEFKKSNPQDHGPPGTLFAQMSSAYHTANAAAKEMKRQIAKLPQDQKDNMKKDFSDLLKQESNDRKEMKKNWPGYDQWKSAKGHEQRIKIINKEIYKLKRQVARLDAKLKATQK